MNVSTYFKTHINPAVLPANLREAHSFVVDATKSGKSLAIYNSDPEIKETVDLSIKKVAEYLKKDKTPKKATAKPKAKKAATVKKATPKRKAKPTVKRKASPKKVAPKKLVMAKKKTIRKAKVKAVRPRKAVIKAKGIPKTPVTIKKLSAELQLIKSFTLMKDKDKKVSVLKSYIKRADVAANNSNVPSQKALLKEITARLKQGLAKVGKAITVIKKMGIQPEFLNKCKETVKNAQPRLQVQYLSGIGEVKK